MAKKMSKPTEKVEEYYKGTVFVNFQSGNEPSDRLLKLMSHFTCEMHEMHIRTYWGIQSGKPVPPAICPPGNNCNG